MNSDSAAVNLLKRAVDLDTKMRYTEALICYQEGLSMLVEMMKKESTEKKPYLRKKIEEYMSRAESIKTKISQMKDEGKYSEQVTIENNSTGHGYHNLFGRFFDETVTSVLVEDPYIRSFHQCQNFVRLMEMAVKKCENLKEVKLITGQDNGQTDQSKWLEDIRRDLENYRICLRVEFSKTLHDRQIVLDNGWIIKIGRGLDYFKPATSKFSIGMFDLDLRNCHETTVNIFHTNNVKKLYG